MSIPVDLASLEARLAEFARAGFLVTVNPNGGPHVVRLGRARGRTPHNGSGRKDPGKIYMFVVVESEEAARARENDPRRREGLQAARATMAEIFDGAPEFVDLTVVEEFTP